MSRVTKINVAVQTRNRKEASTNDKILASIGTLPPIELSGSAPAPGKAGLLTADVDLVYPISENDISLRVNGTDAWSPQEAFM